MRSLFEASKITSGTINRIPASPPPLLPNRVVARPTGRHQSAQAKTHFLVQRNSASQTSRSSRTLRGAVSPDLGSHLFATSPVTGDLGFGLYVVCQNLGRRAGLILSHEAFWSTRGQPQRMTAFCVRLQNIVSCAKHV